MAPTLRRSPRFVAVALRKVCSTSNPPPALHLPSRYAVWGVIWLLIAFCFFAAGLIVGIVAFKVRFSSPVYHRTLLFIHSPAIRRTASIRLATFSARPGCTQRGAWQVAQHGMGGSDGRHQRRRIVVLELWTLS